MIKEQATEKLEELIFEAIKDFAEQNQDVAIKLDSDFSKGRISLDVINTNR